MEELFGKAALPSMRDCGVAPAKLAVGDRALGVWSALAEVYPATGRQRCCVRKTVNVLDKPPKSQQSPAKSMPHEIWQANTRTPAHMAEVVADVKLIDGIDEKTISRDAA